jgi:cell fate (sporulation/competence/biofilm development) regulator YlbF (YheA/YmcA/DUF963 family)
MVSKKVLNEFTKLRRETIGLNQSYMGDTSALTMARKLKKLFDSHIEMNNYKPNENNVITFFLPLAIVQEYLSLDEVSENIRKELRKFNYYISFRLDRLVKISKRDKKRKRYV